MHAWAGSDTPRVSSFQTIRSSRFQGPIPRRLFNQCVCVCMYIYTHTHIYIVHIYIYFLNRGILSISIQSSFCTSKILASISFPHLLWTVSTSECYFGFQIIYLISVQLYPDPTMPIEFSHFSIRTSQWLTEIPLNIFKSSCHSLKE